MSELADIIEEGIGEYQGLLKRGEELNITPKGIRLVQWGSAKIMVGREVVNYLSKREAANDKP